ncbi:MAG: hypothetical protein ABIJ10_06830 [Candidatus Micrarchaeota archaeon]
MANKLDRMTRLNRIVETRSRKPGMVYLVNPEEARRVFADAFDKGNSALVNRSSGTEIYTIKMNLSKTTNGWFGTTITFRVETKGIGTRMQTKLECANLDKKVVQDVASRHDGNHAAERSRTEECTIYTAKLTPFGIEQIEGSGGVCFREMESDTPHIIARAGSMISLEMVGQRMEVPVLDFTIIEPTTFIATMTAAGIFVAHAIERSTENPQMLDVAMRLIADTHEYPTEVQLRDASCPVTYRTEQ